MKRIVLGLLFLMLILTGCGDKVKVSNTEEFFLSGCRIEVESAKIEDDNLEIHASWSFGHDEDSMEQRNFASSGILISAEQNGEILKDNLENSGIYKNIYEMNEGSIYPEFELLNSKDPVELTFYNAATSQSKKVNIEFE